MFAPCKLNRRRRASRRQNIADERKLKRRHQPAKPLRRLRRESPLPVHQKRSTVARKRRLATAASPAAAPATSPAAAPKAKGSHKKAETGTSASPSPAKFSLGDMFKPKSSAAASPAAVSGAAAKNTSAAAAATAPAPGGGHGLVWVNTDSHVYHREGSRFYGTTKKGKYMTEAEAVKEGNRAAGKGE